MEILWRDAIFVPECAVGLTDIGEVANCRIMVRIVMIIADGADEVVLWSECDHFVHDVLPKNHVTVEMEHVFHRTSLDNVFPKQCSANMTVLVCRKYMSWYFYQDIILVGNEMGEVFFGTVHVHFVGVVLVK